MSGTAGQDAGGEGGTAAPPAPDQEVETRARNMGWLPREQYRGDPGRWTDAGTFVERGERMLPLVNERNRALNKTVTELREQSAQQQATLDMLVQTTRNAERLGYKRAMRELADRREAAVESGDKAAFNKVEAEIKDLGPEPAVVETAKPNGGNGSGNGNGAAAPTDPVVAAWVRRNPWFRSDARANAAAVAALSEVQRMNPDLALEEALVEVEQVMREDFPRLFRPAARTDDADADPPPAPRRNTAPMVAAPNTASRAGAPKPRTFDAMPADAKSQYARSVKMLEGKGKPLTKEEFAGYYWDQYEEVE